MAVAFDPGTEWRFTGTGEQLLAEWTDDLAGEAVGTIPSRLAAILSVTGGATLTLRGRVGGTIGAADGTLVAAATTTSATDVQVLNASTFTNPAANSLIKVTGQLSSGTEFGVVRGSVFTLGVTGGGGDSTAPVIQNVTPTPGLIPGTREQAALTPIEFDVIDLAPGLRLVAVSIKFANEADTVVIHDGTRFVGRYTASSTRSAIANGYHYSILRTGGWAGNFDLWAYAIDQAGNLEGTLPP